VDAVTVTSQEVLTAWLTSRGASEIAEPLTFVVTLDGYLRLAPRRSEHVDCAAGQDVLAAGGNHGRGALRSLRGIARRGRGLPG
jgi:hypothetical protein